MGHRTSSRHVVGRGFMVMDEGGLSVNLLWYFFAYACCLYVVVLNGSMFFYYDTASYLSFGKALLGSLENSLRPALNELNSTQEGQAALLIEPITTDAEQSADTKQSARFPRSRLFSFFLGVFAHFKILEAVAVVNTSIVVATVALPVRVFARSSFGNLSVARTTACSLFVASLGSLPFYVAYLMPDIFTPILLLLIATTTAFADKMGRLETFLAFALGSFAVLAHTSHIAIVVVLLPPVVLFSILVKKKRWFVAPIFVVLLAGLGIGEELTFRYATSVRSGNEAIFLPHLTARVVEDGTGFDYLRKHCPNANIPTCALFVALSNSDDPMRLTASHIIFERSPELGSFRLMSADDQEKVARNQTQFFLDVLREYPIRTTYVLLKKVAFQIRLNRVNMTLQNPEIVHALDGRSGLAFGEFRIGHISRSLFWLKPLHAAQQVLYSISFAVVLFALFRPRSVNKRCKVFLALIVMGVLVNALVMGGVSQAATRYGSRVIWLIPLAAMLSFYFSSSKQR